MRTPTPAQIVGILAVTIFIASEVVAASSITVWAVSGLLHFGPVATAVLAVIVGVPTLYGIAVIARLAYRAESDPENN